MADETVINNALAFYNTNMTSTFSVVVDFPTQTAGGTTAVKTDYFGVGYSDYYSVLASNASLTGNPVQVSALGSKRATIMKLWKLRTFIGLRHWSGNCIQDICT